jgi:hypothetical protein
MSTDKKDTMTLDQFFSEYEAEQRARILKEEQTPEYKAAFEKRMREMQERLDAMPEEELEMDDEDDEDEDDEDDEDEDDEESL